jgi:hypothetical protein
VLCDGCMRHGNILNDIIVELIVSHRSAVYESIIAQKKDSVKSPMDGL